MCGVSLCTVLPSGCIVIERWGCVVFFVHVCDIGGTPCDIYVQNGRTPLMEASGGGHVECVKLLLVRGAQANHHNKVSAVLIISDMLRCAYMYIYH